MILFIFEGDDREPRLYKTLERLYFPKNKEKYLKIKDNWQYLKEMNVCKANFLVTNQYAFPTEKSVVNQYAIFDSQKRIYVEPLECVSVLNSFPIFIYEYMK